MRRVKITPEQDAALCARFPHLLKERALSPRESCMGRGFEHGAGWLPLLTEFLERAQESLQGIPEEDRPFLVQIKEKFGQLRVYWDSAALRGTTREAPHPEYGLSVQDLCGLDAALIERSGETCEACGSPGVMYVKSGGGFIGTRCSNCVDPGDRLWEPPSFS